jgi:hypothetical protein
MLVELDLAVSAWIRLLALCGATLLFSNSHMTLPDSLRDRLIYPERY